MNGGDLRIDLDRLLGRIAELGEIGRIDGPAGEWGNARLALTDDDRRGRELVVSWMRDLGLSVADRRDRQRVRHPTGIRSRSPHR